MLKNRPICNIKHKKGLLNYDCCIISNNLYETEKTMLIRYQDLTEDAVYALAKDWVVSNISDTESFPNVSEWTAKTVLKIKKGELLIEFGEESQTVTLKTKDELNIIETKIEGLNENA